MEEKQNKLAELRKERGISQEEAARAFFVSQATYHNWETSKTEPSIQQLLKLADYYDVSVDYMIGRHELPVITRLVEQLTADEQRLLRAFHRLGAEQKKALLVFLESLSKTV